MSTSIDYINYVISCLDSNLAIEYKKMFGEYMIYFNKKPLLLVCDNTVFVKIIPELESI
jgi:TfoX/Sxy family transcriptional regulator of competence genes